MSLTVIDQHGIHFAHLYYSRKHVPYTVTCTAEQDQTLMYDHYSMMEAIDIGARLCSDGHFGTVLYKGSVTGTKGLYRFD